MEQSQRFQKEDSLLQAYQQGIEMLQEGLQEAYEGFQIPQFDMDQIDPSHEPEISRLSDQAKQELEQAQADLKAVLERVAKAKTDFAQELSDSEWQKEKRATDQALAQKKTELEAQGTPVEAIQAENNKKAKLEAELADIQKLEPTLAVERQKKEDIRQAYIQQRQQLTEARRKYLSSAFNGGNVKVKVAPFRDFSQFENGFRKIVSMSGSTYEEEITALKEITGSGKPNDVNQHMVDRLLRVKGDADSSNTFGQRFVNKLKALSEEQWDRLHLLHPEDDIMVEYKSNQASGFKPLSTASPGQKTAAILTLILSQGTMPLILDQPEDDLDNSLIYELVVEQLRQSKEKRQIIVVTHNANIPVNGDSEHIIVMDSESKQVRPKVAGSIEEDAIKRAICDVMEGGTEAFGMRYQRYAHIRTQ
jgi:ATPase subunit of ABC transporter with duplicated ATPase domains